MTSIIYYAKNIAGLRKERQLMKIILYTFCFGSLLLLTQACSSENKTPKDTIVTAIKAPVASLDPLFSTDANSQYVNELIHSALLYIGNDLTPQPYLAEKMKIIDDRTVEFVLKKNCRFHNGQPVTIEDVKYSIEVFTNPKNKSPFSAAFSKITTFTPTGENSFRIKTAQPEASLLTDLSLLKILPKNQYDKDKFRDKPIGAGPYSLVKKSVTDIIVTKFNTGCLATPPTNNIQIKVVREELSQFLKLLKGELDIVLNNLDYRKVKKILEGKEKDLTAIAADGVSFSYIGLNFSNTHLKNKRVRKAIYYAIDIDSIIKYKLAGMAKSASSVLSKESFYKNKKLKSHKRDLAKAKKLLDEAGYFNTENNKEALKLTLKTTTNKLVLENARAIVSQLKEAGIEVEHRSYDWGMFYSDIKARNTEMYLLRWVGVTDPGILYDIFHSSQRKLNNRTEYNNPIMDKYLDMGNATMNKKKRKIAYDKVQEIFLEDLPYIPLWHNKNAVAYRKEIKNVQLHPTGSWISFLKIRKE